MKKYTLALAVLAFFATAAHAAVTVTPASGGTNISADNAANATAPAYTTLGSIVISEGLDTDFAVGAGVTLVLNPPSGWSFNPGAGAVAATNGRNITGEGISVTAAAATVTFTVGGTNKTDSVTISGLQVRPNDGLLANTPAGNITRNASSTSSIAGVSGATNFGSLSMAVGAANKLSMGTQPSATATAGTAFGTQPAVRVEDQHGNLRSADNSTVVTAARNGGGSPAIQGTLTATASGGIATFANLSHNKAETISLAFTAPSLTGTTSNNIVVSAANATTLAFTTDPAGATAGSAFGTQPVVRSFDSFGNLSTAGLAASVPVTFSVASGPGSFHGSSTTVYDIGTGAGNGTVTATNLRIDTAGAHTLGASGLGSATSGSFTVSAGPAAVLAMVQQTPASAAAGVAFSPSPSVRIYDAFGNPVSATDTITATRNSGSGTAALQGTTSVAAVAGLATFSNIKYNVAGETISVDFNASGLTGVTSNAIVVGPGPAASFTVSAPASSTAGDVISVTVTAKDAFGNTATGYTGTVSFSSNDGQAVLPGNYTFVGGDAGTKSFNVTLKTAGNRTVTTQDGGVNGTSNSVNVSAAAAAGLALSAPASATAGSSFSVTVTAKDAYNNTATTYTGTVHFTTNDANGTMPGDVTFIGADNGAKSVSGFILGTSGSRSITGTDTVTASITGNTSVTVNPGAATSIIVIAPANATAGSAISVTVTARDSFNNLATGYTGTVGFTSSDPTATLPSNYTYVPADGGTKSFNVTLKTAGSRTVTANDGTLSDTSNSINVSAAAAASLTVSAPASATAGNAFNFTVTARDAFNNIATGYTGTVAFTSNDGIATLPSNYAFTGGDAGAHTFSATLKTAGNRTITANDGTLNDASDTISVSPAAVAALTVSLPASVTAGNAFSATITAKDAFNNTVTSYGGTIQLTSSDGSATLPPNYTFVPADNGVKSLSVTLVSGGTRSVTATDTGNGAINGSSNTTVNGGAAASLTVTAPANATSNSAFNVTVTARDAFDNVSAGYTGTVSFSSNDGLATLPSNYTFVGGDAGTKTFSVTLRTAGTRTVSVNDGTLNDTSDNIAVAAGTAATITTSAPANATAGIPFNFTVTARDAFNNVATGYTGTVAFTSTDGQAVLPLNYTFTGGDAGQGTFSATLKTAGTRTITANDGTLSDATGNILVAPGAAASFTVALPGSATAGTPFSATITAKDAFNNTATNYTGAIHFTSNDTQATLPGDYTFTGGDAGVHTFTNAVTLRTAGSRSVIATDTVSAATGNSSTTVNPAAVAKLGFTTQPSGAVAGSTFTTVVKTQDAFGNNSTVSLNNNVNVAIALSSGTGTLQGTTPVNAGNNGATPGTATFSDLRIDTIGLKTLAASNNQLTGATSDAFTVAPGPATALFFTTHPGSAAAGTPFGTQPAIESRDAFGNDSSSGLGSSKIVTIALNSGTGPLQGTVTVDIGTGAGNGSATYSGLRIDSAGSKTLSISAADLTGANSNPFTVSAGPAAVLVKLAGDAQTAPGGSTLPIDPSVRVEDAYENTIAGQNVTFSPAAGSGSVTGGSQTSDGSGVATVTSWTIGLTAGGNTLNVSAGAASTAFTATGICTYTTRASGNWNDGTTWVGGCVPVSPDNATIAPGHTVTVTAGTSVNNLTFAAGTSSSAVNVNSGVVLTVDNLLKIEAPLDPNVEAVMNVGNGGLIAGSVELNGAGNRKAILLINNGTAVIDGNATFPGNPPTQQVTITGSGTLEMHGDFAAGATLDFSSASTQLFNGNGAQSIGNYNPNNFFSNLVIDSDVTMLGNLPVSDQLTINSGATLTGGNNTIHLRGDMTVNGTLVSGGTVNVNGSTAQTIDGSTSPVGVFHLTMNNAAGLTLGTNVTMGGTLNLTLGNISTGANTLKIIGTGSISRTSGHVIGNLARVFDGPTTNLFTVGTANGYSPVSVNVTAASFPATFVARAVQSAHPNSPTANALQRYWILTPGGATSANLSFTYLPGDVVGNELAYRLARYSSGWTYPAAAVDTLTHVASASAVTSFGDFTLHAQAVGIAVASVNGGANPIAGTPFDVVVQAVDVLGNPTGVAAGTNVALTLNSGTGPLGGTLNGIIPFGNSSVTISGVTYTKAEPGVILTATATGGVSAADNSDPFTVDPGPATHFTVNAPESTVAGVPFDATITAYDAYENLTPAFAGTVVVTSSDTNATLPANGPLTSGTRTDSITLRTAGSQTLTATSGAVNGFDTIQVLPAATDHFSVTAPAMTTAGAAFDVTVTARDAFDNLTPSYSGTVAFTSSDAGATLPGNYAFTQGDNGAHLFTGLALITAGNQTVTATDNALTGQAAIDVQAGALDHFRVEAAAGGNIGAQTAGTAFNVKLTAQDAYNNTVTGFAGPVQLTSNATMTGAPLTSSAFISGVVASQAITITSVQNGTTVTATDTQSSRTGTSNAFAVEAGAVHHFLLESSSGGAIPAQLVNTPFAIRVTALDAGGNIAASFGGTAEITSNGTLSAGSGTTAAFVSGVLSSHSVTFGNAGTFTLTATRTGGSEAGAASVFVSSPDAPPQADLSVSLSGPASINGGQPFDYSIAVRNNGTPSTSNTTLSLTVPNGWTLTALAPCTSYPCNLGTLNGGAEQVVAFRLTAPASVQSGQFPVTATVSSDSPEPNTANNTSQLSIQLTNCPVITNLRPSRTAPASGQLTWSAPLATSFDVYLGVQGSGCSTKAGTVLSPPFNYSNLQPGQTYEFRIVANRAGCAPVTSACTRFTVEEEEDVCEAPRISAVAETTTRSGFHVRWTGAETNRYLLEQSSNAGFTSPTQFEVTGNSRLFRFDVATPTAFFFRVRGIGGCSTDYSRTLRVVVQPMGSPDGDEFDLPVEHGSADPLTQPAHLTAEDALTARDAGEFTATSNAPWLTVAPSAGSIPPGGVNFSLTANPANLPAGSNTATVSVRSSSNALIASYNVTIHAMQPVEDIGKSAAQPAAVIPAVGHAAGIGSHWRSDVRIYNPSANAAAYELYFTPSQTDGTKEGRKSTMTVDGGATIALGDVVRRLFGYGAMGESATGALEIRPAGDAPLAVISSRTYNQTDGGTYGQFIPAVPTASFAPAGTTLSLQQVAQSAAYRTNVGLVEGSGNGATVTVRVYNAANAKLAEESVALAPFEHRQIDGFLAKHNVSADDARVQVAVTSQKGSVAAYASLVDNITSDPLLVTGVAPASIASQRYVVPGVAHYTTGRNNWRSDLRIFNGGNAFVTATLTFYSESGASVTRDVMLAPRTVKAYDNVLESLFGVTQTGGALHVSTGTASSLVVTARTYDRRDAGGTYGQFIPAMTVADAACLGGRAIDILQVEQSSRFRSNIGLAEVSGAAARVELSAVTGDNRRATTTIDLAANQFIQYSSLLASLGLDDAMNARVNVRVVGGSGAVIAYGSTIDNRTQDPTYVPAQ